MDDEKKFIKIAIPQISNPILQNIALGSFGNTKYNAAPNANKNGTYKNKF